MRTKRDIEILKFVEEHRSITIEQCSKLFFTNNAYGYDQARKRLSKLKKDGFLKRYRKEPRSMSIYYIDKPLKIHDLKLLDAYIELKINFEKVVLAKEVENGSYVLDGVMFINNSAILITEVDYTHYTSMDKIRETIYNNEEIDPRPYTLIVIKYTQQEIEFKRIGDYSFLYILPWNLKDFYLVKNKIKDILNIN